ncbi:MAG: Fe-S cluster assembly transcription factor [Methylococcales bacterium]|jgi:Rrf2 family iron-sulfur cluster assembly transcriptional regulator|nr:Fe-S cluster assembly transcription factor [Methylococcales bacterium]MCX7076303.1 Fe-S cluster assembly transcription factor [Methylococcales bacterium]
MRLTTKGRYAVTAMLDLVLHSQNTPVTLTEIATRQTISLSYLEQLFSRLRKADLVKGVRGPGGGYRIRQTPELISIASIIEAVNEPIDSTKCGGEENCQHDSICLTHDLWAGLSDHIQDYLSQITLADLIAQRDERRNIVKCSESIVKFEKPLKYG